MSPTIWTQCGGLTNARPLLADAFRVVEGQHVNSTRKLVDSDLEQELLEELIETAKPPRPAGPEFAQLHFLLYTPFRHPPLRGGTRFGGRFERGLFYGSKAIETCLAEWAFYRFVFLEGTAADLGTTTTPVTTFKARVAAKVAVDLALPPFAAFRDQLVSPTSYAATQPLGTEMRAAGVEAFAFSSARQEGGTNYGLFAPCFGSSIPSDLGSWFCTFDRQVVEYQRVGVLSRTKMRFPREQFENANLLYA